MPLPRALLILALCILASAALTVSVAAEDPEPRPQIAVATWDQRPDTVEELADDATVLVEAEVSGIEQGPAIVSGHPEDDPADSAIPTQRVLFETVEVLEGQIPATFKVFKTGSETMRLEGDPFYEVGERYVLFLSPQGEPGTYLPTAPDGRLELDAEGEAEPVIGGPVGEDLEGLTPEEIAAEAGP